MAFSTKPFIYEVSSMQTKMHLGNARFVWAFVPTLFSSAMSYCFCIFWSLLPTSLSPILIFRLIFDLIIMKRVREISKDGIQLFHSCIKYDLNVAANFKTSTGSIKCLKWKRSSERNKKGVWPSWNFSCSNILIDSTNSKGL